MFWWGVLFILFAHKLWAVVISNYTKHWRWKTFVYKKVYIMLQLTFNPGLTSTGLPQAVFCIWSQSQYNLCMCYLSPHKQTVAWQLLQRTIARQLPWLLTLAISVSFVFLKPKKHGNVSQVWNVFMWITLIVGNGLLMCLYSQEWFATQICPRNSVSKLNPGFSLIKILFSWPNNFKTSEQ